MDFTADRNVYSARGLANVVGAVKDYETEEMIPGATISIDGEILVATGADGRFQIRNFPSGVYDWQIDAAGYYTAEYSNYDVDYLDGATIFTFYISDDFAVQKDRVQILNENTCEQQELSAAETAEEEGIARAVSKTMTAPPEINSEIYVYYNESVHKVGREQYIYTVLSSELYTPDWYVNDERGLTAAQRHELFVAQAIAANTYVEYHISVDNKHSGSGYDVCSEGSCQKYDPSKVTQEAINAASHIFYYNGKDVCDMIMYKPTSATYEYAFTEFFSSCYGKGTENVLNRPYSNKVDCTDLATGYGGHRRGMCQMGAAQRAKNGERANEILSYYYTNVEIVPCPLK